MDWSKAKNILIIAFILTNIFLFYYVGKGLLAGSDLNLISDQYIADVESHLKENGIHISGDIPKEIISLPKVMVRFREFNHEEILELFMENNYHRISEATYKNENQKLIIEGNKKIIYKNSSEEKVADHISEIVAQEISNEFLKEKGLLDKNIELKQIFYQKYDEFSDLMTYKLVYHQVYKNRFLGESYIHVYVNETGVVGLEGMLLETDEGSKQQKKLLIPATTALLRKMNDMINDNRGEIVVRSIEVGYYFNPYDVEFTDWTFIESGTAVPAWKITLENGKIYYVEALKN